MKSFLRSPAALAAAMLVIAAVAGVAMAQSSASYKIDWHTTDTGGISNSVSSPSYKLSVTVGQSDPGLTGSASYLSDGGYWPGTRLLAGCCPGDLNGDHKADGDDIELFVTCLFGGGSNCGCGDFNGNLTVDSADVPLFVNSLLNGGCP